MTMPDGPAHRARSARRAAGNADVTRLFRVRRLGVGLALLAPEMEFLALTPAGGLPGCEPHPHERSPFATRAAAARALDLSEAELVALACGAGVRRLQGPFGDLLRGLPALGTVHAVTRTASAEMAVVGRYPAPDAGSAGAAGDVGIRVHLERWCHGYVLDAGVFDAEAPSLCIFDDRGDFVHEIGVDARTDRRAFEWMADVLACFDQTPGQAIAVATPRIAHASTDGAAWLRRAQQARPVSVDTVPMVLANVRVEPIGVSIAVRSRGVEQQYSGHLDGAKVDNGILELAAPALRARVDLGRIVEAWVLRTASLDGPTTSLELLDGQATLVASIASMRVPGRPEPVAWTAMLDGVPTSG